VLVQISLIFLSFRIPVYSSSKLYIFFTTSVRLASVGDGGGIYLIETKLFKNQDKRKVVAQTLDYAADGPWALLSGAWL
jgi:hypothetical protein